MKNSDVKHGSSSVDRRQLMKSAAALVAGGVTTGCGAAPKTETAGETGIVCNDTNAVVETTAGKVRGYTRNGIHSFKGIPYGAPPVGPLRYMPATAPQPWTGVRSSLSYGKTCPQQQRTGWDHDEEAFIYHWDDGQQGEACLHVNIWSPGLDSKKRPVMLWIHGGGYQAGSSQELPSYPGENLARRGDVVVVGLNHRLGAFGFLNLAGYGSQYVNSANLGMLDIVSALEWIRNNIANFGGDPANVTIFGQSGGGGKVSTLMAMPAAKGLFHKAIVESGAMMIFNQPADSAKLADAVVSELKLSKAQIAKIHDVPFQSLQHAAEAAVAKLSGPPPKPGQLPRLLWAPTVDGKVLPGIPFKDAAPELSADVPMITGSVLHEFVPSIDHPEAEALTEDQLKQQLTESHGNKASQILEILHKAYPKQNPAGLSYIVGADLFRSGVAIQGERKSAQGKAPVYIYMFTRENALLGGRAHAYHCAEIPYVFDNTDQCDFSTGGGAEARALAAKMSDAWINFAREGDPNHPGIPTWPAYNKETAQIMIFDNQCEAKTDPERELRGLLQS